MLQREFSCVIIALIPLCSILVEVFKNGISAISYEFLTTVPGAVGSGEGGIGPAIQGTLIIIGLSSLIGIPIGVMSGIYLSEYGVRIQVVGCDPFAYGSKVFVFDILDNLVNLDVAYLCKDTSINFTKL